jgi:hypothetical protein
MRHLILLRGVDDTGKTTKINRIAQRIINNHGAANTIGLDPSNLRINTFGILSVGNLRIGINSAGDNQAEVEKSEKIRNAVNILICACRTKGKPFRYFDSYLWPEWFTNILNVPWHRPSDVSAQASRDANLLESLRLLLTGLPK